MLKCHCVIPACMLSLVISSEVKCITVEVVVVQISMFALPNVVMMEQIFACIFY